MKILLLFIVIVFIILLIVFLYTFYRLHTSLHLHVSANTDNVARYQHLQYETRYFRTIDGIKIAS